MNRYQQLFTQLEAKNEGAFIPFVVLGDPDYEQSKEILRTLIDSGADALEVSILFTDPVADGPAIQDAVLRAFAADMSVARSFDLLKEIRDEYPDIPIGLLMYANLVHAAGIDAFYARAKEAGVDSVLVADVPVREYHTFHKAAVKHKIDPILICPPDASDETIEAIAHYGSGYTYLVSRAGVTGMETQAEVPLKENIARLEQANAAPIVQGFGIGTPEQVAHFIASGVKGVISGSAIAELIKEHLTDRDEMLRKLAQFTAAMKAATQR